LREVASIEGDNLIVIGYLSASEILPDKRGDLWWGELIAEYSGFILVNRNTLGP
jgi:hypothetical protein